jgi:exosortase
MIHDDSISSAQVSPPGIKQILARAGSWPRPVLLTVFALLALFAPVLWEAGEMWWKYEDYAHGFFIVPLSLALVWLQRGEIQKARPAPSVWGVVPLALGLALETLGYLLRVKFVATIALIPVLYGVVLLLHGKDLWRIVRFSVFFLFFAAPIPGALLAAPSNWVQSASSTGASILMKAIGYPIIQTGNLIEIPGMTLEVADVCSGFKKLTAFLAFSLLYGYFFSIGWGKRLALFVAAVPIALAANIIRVSGLIMVAHAGGQRALNTAHDWAEIFVLIVAFFIFVFFGKLIGCKTPRFSL